MDKHAFLDRARVMMTPARALVTTNVDTLIQWRARAMRAELRDVRIHLSALALAVAAALLQLATDAGAAAPFFLFHIAVAVAAAAWGFSAAAVAALVALLAARTLTGVPWPHALLFLIEAALVAAVIVRLRKALYGQRQQVKAAEAWLLELKASERWGRLVDGALSHLDAGTSDCAVVILDSTGAVADWRAGAARLYGHERAAMLASSAAVLFGDTSGSEFSRVLASARRGGVRHHATQRRSSGQLFDAELNLTPLSRGGLDGFALVVRDLSGQQAQDALRVSADEAFARLQEEADTAQRQLATLQHVTDPTLNTLDGPDFIPTILERLRASIGAEGIALVQQGRFRRRVFCAEAGLQCVRGVVAPLSDTRIGDPDRTLMIHNDPAAVAESSAAVWPVGVGSLMAVPVARAGSRQAVLEVVNRTGRRASEWEIALVQVAAARIAGFLRDDPYADAGAVA